MGNNIEEIDAEEGEERLERVGAIDVAKASGKVCVRIPGKQRRVTRVWDVGATTNAIMALADELADLRIERVVLEATSDYWRPFFSAPRGALTSPTQWGGIGGENPWVQWLTWTRKRKGTTACHPSRLSCPGVRGEETVDPRDMAKA